MRTITLTIPIIDTGHSPEEKIRKMHEELDELLSEFSGKVDKPAALSEMFDVVQVMVGYLIASNKERDYPLRAYNDTEKMMHMANKAHVTKIRKYAAKRGWEVVE
jgi:hypothetical protein